MTEARRSVEEWLRRRGGTIFNFVFPIRVDYLGHLSTRQYARLVDEWVSIIGLDKREYGAHSMRRTKASLIYKATGNLRAIQILLGHTNIENTVRYLGVDVDDALTLSERTDIWEFAGLRYFRRPATLLMNERRIAANRPGWFYDCFVSGLRRQFYNRCRQPPRQVFGHSCQQIPHRDFEALTAGQIAHKADDRDHGNDHPSHPKNVRVVGQIELGLVD